jgi:PTH1 family peptidyl-tRNA hydrolase
MVLDRLALDLGFAFKNYGTLGLVCEGKIEDNRFCLLKPLTYMNRSGRAVGELKDHYGVPFARVLVVGDEFQLPLGRIRFRRKGSDGGHNGLKSIIRSLGTEAFPRLRVGIGPLPEDVDPMDYVLDAFEPMELDNLKPVLASTSEAVRLWIRTQDIDLCMNRFNTTSDPD